KRAEDLEPLVEAILNGKRLPLSEIARIGRALIIASSGHRLIAADYTGIESVTCAWIAGEEWKVEQWAKFLLTRAKEDDPYLQNGKLMGVLENPRGVGKQSDLAFNFAGGVPAWRKMAPLDTTPDEVVEERKQQWRKLHPNIVKLWSKLERAAIGAIL